MLKGYSLYSLSAVKTLSQVGSKLSTNVYIGVRSWIALLTRTWFVDWQNVKSVIIFYSYNFNFAHENIGARVSICHAPYSSMSTLEKWMLVMCNYIYEQRKSLSRKPANCPVHFWSLIYWWLWITGLAIIASHISKAPFTLHLCLQRRYPSGYLKKRYSDVYHGGAIGVYRANIVILDYTGSVSHRYMQYVPDTKTWWIGP